MSNSYSIGLGVEAIATVLQEDTLRRSNGDEPIMSEFTQGGLFDALKYIGRSIDNDQVINGVVGEEIASSIQSDRLKEPLSDKDWEGMDMLDVFSIFKSFPESVQKSVLEEAEKLGEQKKLTSKAPSHTEISKKEMIDKELHCINDNLIELIEAQDGIRSIGMGMKTDIGDMSAEGFVVTSMATLIKKLTNDIGRRLDAVGEEVEELKGMKFNW